MTEIRFYHLERQTLEQALPALVSKAYENGRRIVIRAANDKDAARLNDHLWSYDPNSFLPHGAAKDGRAEQQPIWITAADENPNGADVLILTQGTQTEILDQFSLCCEVFDGRDQGAVTQARTHWKAHQDGDHEMTYWQQSESGWTKKN